MTMIGIAREDGHGPWVYWWRYKGGRIFFFSKPHVELSKTQPPDKGGGVSDKTSSTKHHTNLTPTSNRTQGTVDSRPPPAYIYVN